MAWCYHYLPFFLMGRQLFLHHYLPALYFAILMLCVTFDLACRFIPIRFRFAALIVVSLMAILVFRTRAPLAYGSEWTRSQCEASKVLKTWDYDCYQYPESYVSYKAPKDDSHMFGRIVQPNSAPVPAPAVPIVAGGVGEDPKNDKPHDFLEHLFPHAPSPAAAVVPDEVAAAGGSKADSGMENIQLGNNPNYQAAKDHAAAGAVVSPTKQDPVAPAAVSPPDQGSIRHAAAAAAKAAVAGAGAGAGKAPPNPIIEEHVGEGGDDSGAEDVEDVPDVEDIEEEDEEEEERVLQEGDEGFNEPGAEEEAEAEAVEDEFIDTKSELTAAAAAEAAADKKDEDEKADWRHAL